MSFDDEVRRHLHDTGEQVTLTPGLVETVRVRAAVRARRRRRIFSGLTSLAVLAIAGGLVTVFVGGTDQDRYSTEIAERAEQSVDNEESGGELTQNSDSQPLVASASPTYETVPPSGDN